MAEDPPFTLHPRHGGDLAFAEARYGRPDGRWLDLSTGVNPNPWPAPSLPPESLTRLPARDALAGLTAAARRAYRAAEGADLIAVPGSEIAIRLLPLVAPAGAVAIVSPTYSSHADAWRAAGRAVNEVASLDDITDDAAVLVLANPNNPDGRVVAPERLIALARHLDGRGGLLVVDEAFADVAPEASLAPHLTGLSAVVLRSLGKFYGLPGPRLGFVAGAEPIVAALARLMGDWPVSGPAIAIGQAALADEEWRATTRARLAQGAARLRDLLTTNGFAIIGGTDLFVLVRHRDAGAIHAALARRGIWTRAFDERPEWLRLGLPADDAGLARLGDALRAVIAAA